MLDVFDITVAICCLEKEFSLQLKNELYGLANKNKIEITVECFATGREFLNSRKSCSLIFLGCFLQEGDGLKTALRLRSNNDGTPIVFISNYGDFPIEGFKARPSGVIFKNGWRETLHSLLKGFFEKMCSSYPILVKEKNGTVCINTESIYYLEACNKHCYIHLKNEILCCNKTMAQVFARLPQNCFCKINRAFIVNLSCVSRYSSEAVILKNGREIHPGRKYYTSFKEAYKGFLKPIEV